MFCTILEYFQVPNDTPIHVIHNNIPYTFSKHLSITYSQLLSAAFTASRDKPIQIDLECSDDDFKFVLDLFNYKRIFISQFNIDFIETAANYFKVQKLIDDVNSYKLDYHELVENPIFEDLFSLSNDIFSMNIIDFNEDAVLSKTKTGDSYTLKYDEKYCSSIAHFLYFACISHPMKIEFYFQFLKNDKSLYNEFLKLMNSNIFTPDVSTIFHLTLDEESPLLCKKKMHHFEQDNNLSEYFRTINEMMTSYFKSNNINDESIIQIISNDDIDTFQSICVQDSSLFDPCSLLGFREFNKLLKFTLMYGALKCFKYLWLSEKITITESILQWAIIGGNLEIFRILHQTKSPLDWKIEYLIKDAILLHRNNILEWIIENYVQFLPIYSTCCSFLIYKTECVEQKWYSCSDCHTENQGCCKFCAEHCHISTEEHHHEINYKGVVNLCYCDDACQISDIELNEKKKFIEIDNLVLLSIISGNIEALRILIDNGADVLNCRDGIASYAMTLNDKTLFALFKNMTRFDIAKDNVLERIFDDTDSFFKS